MFSAKMAGFWETMFSSMHSILDWASFCTLFYLLKWLTKKYQIFSTIFWLFEMYLYASVEVHCVTLNTKPKNLGHENSSSFTTSSSSYLGHSEATGASRFGNITIGWFAFIGGLKVHFPLKKKKKVFGIGYLVFVSQWKCKTYIFFISLLRVVD